MNLAQQPPGSAADLEQRSRGQRALRSPQRTELLELLAPAVSEEEIANTAAIPMMPQGAAKQALGVMKQKTDALATELDLPPAPGPGARERRPRQSGRSRTNGL